MNTTATKLAKEIVRAQNADGGVRLAEAGTAPRRPRILHVGKFYPPHMGGIETHLQALCGELRKETDLRVIVASDDRLASEDTLNLDGVLVSRLATSLKLAGTTLCPGMIAR